MTKVCIVTGGGRGIGASTSRLVASKGYAVCVNYLGNREAAQSVVTEIERSGGRAMALGANVADESEVVRLFETVDRELGTPDALVNNAGILGPQMRVEEMSAERINHVLSVNVTGVFLCAREAVRRMSTRHGGRGGAIVNVSSAAARLGSPNEYVDYAASKGAVDSLTLGLAREVAPDGIRVNAVRPGLIYTDIHASGGDPGRVQRLEKHVPMLRGGDPDEVAQAIWWLLSDEASYVTATFVECSGGR